MITAIDVELLESIEAREELSSEAGIVALSRKGGFSVVTPSGLDSEMPWATACRRPLSTPGAGTVLPVVFFKKQLLLSRAS